MTLSAAAGPVDDGAVVPELPPHAPAMSASAKTNPWREDVIGS